MKRFFFLLSIVILCCGFVLPTVRAGEADPLLTLVNAAHPVPADWKVDPVSIGGGQRADSRCVADLQALLAASKAAGHKPYVRSSYRTYGTQQSLYNNKVAQYRGYGYNEADARKKAAAIVAPPGTSEHQLGLAFDIVDSDYSALNKKQADTATQQWLMAHSWEYGFILRYPVDKTQITGIIYEPWHYRYVGREHAKAIFDSGLCLEEWLEAKAAREAQALAIARRDKAVADAIDADLRSARRRSYILLWQQAREAQTAQ